MNVRVCVFGLWHLGCVTAACLAAEGVQVTGLDLDEQRVRALRVGQPPISEPGLTELIQACSAAGKLAFSNAPEEALGTADVLWVTFDTPVDADDQADPGWVRAQLEAVRSYIQPATLVIVSSQVPVGFTTALEREWRTSLPGLQFACCPENLRLGQAIEAFRHPARVIIGVGTGVDRACLEGLFRPYTEHIEWMSIASAEMTKHALNGFLAMSVAYTNELARICERVGADAGEVERGLRTEPRIGQRAYVSAGPPIAGGTLTRDIAFLGRIAADNGVDSPLIDAVLSSNRLHAAWTRDWVRQLLQGVTQPRAALLGLTYKAGTDTLRRSSALELAAWLASEGISVCAFDPAVETLPNDAAFVELAHSIDEALAEADVAVLATGWPEFRALRSEQLVHGMRHPQLIDQAGFVSHLSEDPRVTYVRVGRPVTLNQSHAGTHRPSRSQACGFHLGFDLGGPT